MRELRNFLKTTLLGGALVLLPAALLVVVTRWLFNIILSAVQPLTTLLVTTSQFQEISASLLVLAILFAGCFVVGFLVKTRLGAYFHVTIEENILKIMPGYSLIKETVMQLVGGKKSPFSTVALVRLYDSDVLTTAFITDTHDDGSYTVFVPTAPNPTSGLVFHLKSERVQPVSVSVEDTMRTILGCGVGSTKIFEVAKRSSTKA